MRPVTPQLTDRPQRIAGADVNALRTDEAPGRDDEHVSVPVRADPV